MKFVAIEQDEEGTALITYITSKDYEKARKKYRDKICYGGEFVVLTQDDFNNLCIGGCGG